MCVCLSIVCNKSKKFLNYKTNEKNEKVNLILSHANHIFFILKPRIEPQTFRHTHFTLRNFTFF
jgi:hypothetical protein